MAIDKDLLALGLREKEAQLYLTLADEGKATAHTLSKRSGWTRSTVYFLLEELMQRGLVSSEPKKGTTFFIAQPPSALVQLFQREEEAARQRREYAERVASDLLPRFKALFSRSPRVQLVEGQPAVNALLYNSGEVWHRSMLETDCTWWGFEDASLFEFYRPWFEHIWNAYEADRLSKLRVRVFTPVPVAPSVEERFPLTRLRQFPVSVKFPATLWLMGDYLALFATGSGIHYCYQLHDRLLAESLRIIFRLLWEE